jgi:hypothetical protein
MKKKEEILTKDASNYKADHISSTYKSTCEPRSSFIEL